MATTETPMTERAYAFVKELQKEGATSPTALLKTMSLLMASDSHKRMATVWEQAAILLFLLSAEASNLTGGVFATDGGWTTY
jgi:NAD(P)-dependent dehydrogenase (short-subunit alcohol dehydrogenase family)